ncbi:tetratricopeptide repeat protein [Paraurantiacibacter namhicola]|uniref:Tetratricopeptide repeat protein n=1 Tax=Paraurantiacibacter namhicola TaxID=645517 RepID=A0A1C7D8Q7_9SPHN|nr:tetratricopeptide repeat protein [Paraurantiacibacter namhicola]ANU07825.1 Tetratricopeptide repeat protein [Paraurantiacibacter namhicola]
MRYYPAGIALSLALAATASMGVAAPRQADPRAVTLVAEGRAQLEAGQTQSAIDSFEAALAVDPGYVRVFIELGDAARQSGMQGKAIHYYREAQERDPGNLAAIAGEGAALAEKGATAKANEKLAMLESLCGKNCIETRYVATAIARGPVVAETVLTAEAVQPDAGVTQN